MRQHGHDGAGNPFRRALAYLLLSVWTPRRQPGPGRPDGGALRPARAGRERLTFLPPPHGGYKAVQSGRHSGGPIQRPLSEIPRAPKGPGGGSRGTVATPGEVSYGLDYSPDRDEITLVQAHRGLDGSVIIVEDPLRISGPEFAEIVAHIRSLQEETP